MSTFKPYVGTQEELDQVLTQHEGNLYITTDNGGLSYDTPEERVLLNSHGLINSDKKAVDADTILDGVLNNGVNNTINGENIKDTDGTAKPVAANAIGTKNIASNNHTLAYGCNCQARGTNSIALTDGAIARGGFSLAGGSQAETGENAPSAISYGGATKALGTASQAFGYNTQAIGNYSTSLGFDTIANGEASLVIGHTNTAIGPYSLVGGNGCSTLTTGSCGIGYGVSCTVSGYASMAFGRNVSVSSNYSFGSGQDNVLTGAYSFLAGFGNAVSGAGSGTIGSTNTVSGNYSFSAGNKANVTGNYSAGFGYDTLNEGHFAQTFGYGTKTIPHTGKDYLPQAAFGYYNNPTANSLFMVGYGASDTARLNVFEIENNGTVKIKNSHLGTTPTLMLGNARMTETSLQLMDQLVSTNGGAAAIYLKSPNKTIYKLTVTDAGALSVVKA